jgi:hypothetical protein
MPALRQEPGKLIERTWTTRGADGRKVRHTALGYDLTVNGKRERKFSSAWLTEQDVLDALTRRRRELGQGLEPVADWTLTDLAREIPRAAGVARPAWARLRGTTLSHAPDPAPRVESAGATLRRPCSPGTSTSGPAK